MDQNKPPAPFAPLVLVATVAIIGLIAFGAYKLKHTLDVRNQGIAEAKEEKAKEETEKKELAKKTVTEENPKTEKTTAP